MPDPHPPLIQTHVKTTTPRLSYGGDLRPIQKNSARQQRIKKHVERWTAVQLDGRQWWPHAGKGGRNRSGGGARRRWSAFGLGRGEWEGEGDAGLEETRGLVVRVFTACLARPLQSTPFFTEDSCEVHYKAGPRAKEARRSYIGAGKHNVQLNGRRDFC